MQESLTHYVVAWYFALLFAMCTLCRSWAPHLRSRDVSDCVHRTLLWLLCMFHCRFPRCKKHTFTHNSHYTPQLWSFLAQLLLHVSCCFSHFFPTFGLSSGQLCTLRPAHQALCRNCRGFLSKRVKHCTTLGDRRKREGEGRRDSTQAYTVRSLARLIPLGLWRESVANV